MTRREYRAVPLPAMRTRRNRNAGERVAEAVQAAINEMAARGWTYLRAETVRAMESQGLLRGREEVAYTVLVFDRALDEGAPEMGDDHAFEAPARARREGRGRFADDARSAAPTPFEDDAFDGAAASRSPERRPMHDAPRRSETRAGEGAGRSAAQDRLQERLASRRVGNESGGMRDEDDFRPARRREALDDGAALGRRLRGAGDAARNAVEPGPDERGTGDSGFISRAPRPERHRR